MDGASGEVPGVVLTLEFHADDLALWAATAPLTEGVLTPFGDLDHEPDFARGGPTSAENLAPQCRRDHNLKPNDEPPPF